MDHGCVDVGLLVQPFDTEKYESRPIGKPSRMGVYMRADDPLAKKPEVWMQDLEGRPRCRGFVQILMRCSLPDIRIRIAILP